MKKISLLLFVSSLILCFYACDKEDKSLPKKIEEKLLSQVETTYNISISDEEKGQLIGISSEGASIALKIEISKVTTVDGVTTTDLVNISEAPKDILTISSSLEGITTVLTEEGITVSIDENKSSEREGTITISPKSGTPIVLQITQKASSTYIDRVDIAAGSFMMGSPDTEEGRDPNEGPQHEVTLSAFSMSKYPITFAQYDAFCEATGRDIVTVSAVQYYDEDYNEVVEFRRGNYPVVGITHNDAKAFAEWAGGRLPTEAEWEYACRAGSKTAYFFGDDKNLLGEYAWYIKNSEDISKKNNTHPVGEKKPNPWGLYDMLGNVEEFCSDKFDAEYYSQSPEVNPQGSTADQGRRQRVVVRGGNIAKHDNECRSASRDKVNPNFGTPNTGFRVVFPK